MATIFDVARYAGVSKSTVSNVLNKSSSVKEETRIRVEEAIKELGYVRNPNAVGLRKQATKALGIIACVDQSKVRPYEVDGESGRYVYGISNGILDTLAGSEYSVITERCYFPKDDGKTPRIVKNALVDGIIIIGGYFSAETITKIRSRYDMPVVVVGEGYEGVDVVSPGFERATYLATDELLKNGCRDLVFLNAPAKVSNANLKRKAGWNQALEQYRDDQIQHIEVYVPANSGGGGYAAMKEVWERGIRPDGVTIANEKIALGAMRYLEEQGVKVPEDVCITAYDASDIGTYANPPITSVNIHKARMGAAAVELLLNRIKYPDAPFEKRLIEPTMLYRESVRQIKK